LNFCRAAPLFQIRSQVRFAPSARVVPIQERRKIYRDFTRVGDLGISVALGSFKSRKIKNFFADSVFKPIKFFEVTKDNVF
jgi:hypothetical protein